MAGMHILLDPPTTFLKIGGATDLEIWYGQKTHPRQFSIKHHRFAIRCCQAGVQLFNKIEFVLTPQLQALAHLGHLLSQGACRLMPHCWYLTVFLTF